MKRRSRRRRTECRTTLRPPLLHGAISVQALTQPLSRPALALLASSPAPCPAQQCCTKIHNKPAAKSVSNTYLLPPCTYPRPLLQSRKMGEHDHCVLVRRLSHPRAEGVRRRPRGGNVPQSHRRAHNCDGNGLSWPWRTSADGCRRAGDSYRYGRGWGGQ